MKLKNILIVVDDVERSKNFYCHLFVLRVVTDFGGNVILTEGLVKGAGRVAGTGKISSCACRKCVGETGCQNRRPGRAYDRNR